MIKSLLQFIRRAVARLKGRAHEKKESALDKFQVIGSYDIKKMFDEYDKMSSQNDNQIETLDIEYSESPATVFVSAPKPPIDYEFKKMQGYFSETLIKELERQYIASQIYEQYRREQRERERMN